MRSAARLLLLAALLLPHAAAAGPPLRVLFVGNSLTYYNDLPATFATLYRATRPDTQVETEMLAQGGAKLREHLETGQVAALLKQHRYDVVVLQELGGFPVCADDFPGCADAPAAMREAVDLVRAHGARPVWFSTWQQQPEAQLSLSSRSAALAGEVDVDIVDVGAAMHRVAASPGVQLLDESQHPAPAGTWLIAAALVDALAGRPLPAGAPPRSCGTDWRGYLVATEPASRQRRDDHRDCHALTAPQWHAVRAAVRQ